MSEIRSFRDLRVYQAALHEATLLMEASRRFPASERFGLTDQMRRSSRAVSALVAEAWARRVYPKAFVAKLVEALGEAQETQAWLDHALNSGLIGPDEFAAFDARWQGIGGQLTRMIQHPDSFKPRDPRPE